MEDFVEGNPAWEEWSQDLRRRNRIAVVEARLREIARLEDLVRRLEAYYRSEGLEPPSYEEIEAMESDEEEEDWNEQWVLPRYMRATMSIDVNYPIVDVDHITETQVCPSPISIPPLQSIFEKPFEGPQEEEALEEKKLNIVDKGIP